MNLLSSTVGPKKPSQHVRLVLEQPKRDRTFDQCWVGVDQYSHPRRICTKIYRTAYAIRRRILTKIYWTTYVIRQRTLTKIYWTTYMLSASEFWDIASNRASVNPIGFVQYRATATRSALMGSSSSHLPSKKFLKMSVMSWPPCGCLFKRPLVDRRDFPESGTVTVCSGTSAGLMTLLWGQSLPCKGCIGSCKPCYLF